MNREQIAYERGFKVTKNGCLIGLRGRKIGSINSNGYEMTSFTHKNKEIIIRTHRLQAYQKYGNKLFEDGIVVRHLNGNKLDNSWDNIAIGTIRDNHMDIPKEQRIRRAIPSAKLKIKYSKEFVLKLKEEYKLVKSYKELSIKYNMPLNYIWYLINKRKVFKDA